MFLYDEIGAVAQPSPVTPDATDRCNGPDRWADHPGLGLFLGGGGVRFGHSGGNEGFRCHLLDYRTPDRAQQS